MRVGILHNAYTYRGGEERVVEAEGALLRSHGHEVSELIFDSREHFATLGQGLRSVRNIARGWNSDAAERIANWAVGERLDVVHIHNIFPLITGAGIDGLRRAGVPTVMTLHNFRPLCAAGTLTRNGERCDDCVEGCGLSAVTRGCYRDSRVQSVSWALAVNRASRAGVWSEAVDAFLAPSEHVRETFVRGGFPGHKVVVRPHFTDMRPVRASDVEGVVVVGRIDNSKGIVDLIESWSDDGPTLTVVGTGPDESRARSVASNRVRFTGQLGGDDLSAVVSKAGVLIAPSRLPETFGLTLIEAAACGVPVVAFDAGAAESIIENGKTGIVVRDGGMPSLVRAAVGLCGSKILRSEMSKAAADRYERLYSPAAGIASLEAVYERVVGAAQECAA